MEGQVGLGIKKGRLRKGSGKWGETDEMYGKERAWLSVWSRRNKLAGGSVEEKGWKEGHREEKGEGGNGKQTNKQNEKRRGEIWRKWWRVSACLELEKKNESEEDDLEGDLNSADWKETWVDPNNCRNEKSGSTCEVKRRKEAGSEGFRGEERLSGCFGIIQQMRRETRRSEWGHARRMKGGVVSECPGLKGQIRPRIGDGKVENIK